MHQFNNEEMDKIQSKHLGKQNAEVPTTCT